MSKQKKAVILIGFLPNPRMYKRIELEKGLFDELHLICWDKGSNMLPAPTEDNYMVHCFKIDAGKDPLKRMIPYRKFSAQAYALLEKIKPDSIHVQGLDMLKIACKYKKKHGARVIYEVADLHRLLVDKQKNPVRAAAQIYLKSEDKKLTKSIDLLIITSLKYAERYFNAFVPKEKIFYFPNVPNLSAFQGYRKKERNGSMTVGYIGSVRYKKQIINLIDAVKACDMNLMIAGFEPDPIEIEPLCRNYKHGEWVGRFDFATQVKGLYEKCDLMYSVYDADMANVRVALPNKLYEAVYCEMPLIVAKGTYLEEVVNEWGVGVGVDHRDSAELTRVLDRFKNDPDYYNKMVENCRLHKEEADLAVYNRKLKDIISSLD